jgi:uncharacterized repeat protein (TIGR01451 family)
MADDILNRMATDNLARQLSASWTYPIEATTEQIFLQFAAQGQAYFNASGDNGAYTGTVDTPTDNPNVIVVGGTSLTTTGPGGAWTSESVWNRGGSGQTLGGSGGGISTVYPIPSWQSAVDMTTNHGSTTMRNLPDVSAVAEDVWVAYDNGSSETVGGTSCSTPLWAAFLALVNQQAASFGRPPVGFINPAIYKIGLSPGYATNFHDVTVGSNTNAGSPTQFLAVRGYDLCTGWGSPIGQNLINALAPRIQAPFLTNAGATLLVEGCLPANGTIDPGETVTVNFTLKNLGAVKTTNLVATLLADDGVLWPGPAQSYGALTGGGAAVSRSFVFTANGTCGGTLAATLQLSEGSNSLGNLVFRFPLGQSLIAVTQNFDAATPPALPSTWSTTATNGVSRWIVSTGAHDTGANAAFAEEPPMPGIEELISPSFQILSTGAQLTFRNSFNTEADTSTSSLAYDGGVLEIQIGTNDFVDILAAGGVFVSGGYNRTILTGNNSDNPFSGRQVWGGNSGGFITSVINLPTATAGQTVRLKWRFGLDSGNFYGGFGWYIDSVLITDSGTCCSSGADLSLSATAAPDSIAPGQILTYSVSVTNTGPVAAFGVTVTNLLPEAVIFSWGSPGCTYSNGFVFCDTDILPGNSATNYNFGIIPTRLDAITNASVVGAITTDPNPTNNTAWAITAIITNTPPVVYVEPTNAVAASGAVAMLRATAFGVGPLTYQWLFNGAPLSGATSNALWLTNVQPEQSGAYSLVVTNVNGATTSPVVQLTVLAPPIILLTGFNSTGTNVSVSLSSTLGVTYTLEYKNSLIDDVWTPIVPPTPGTGGIISLQDTSNAILPARFYRVTAR